MISSIAATCFGVALTMVVWFAFNGLMVEASVTEKIFMSDVRMVSILGGEIVLEAKLFFEVAAGGDNGVLT